MRENLPDIIRRFEAASIEAAKYQREIIRLICDAVRDVIPDILGWVGTPENQNLMYFDSEEFTKRFFDEEEKKANPYSGRLFGLIVEVFPDLRFKTFDNGIYLTPEEQVEIKERLERLKED